MSNQKYLVTARKYRPQRFGELRILVCDPFLDQFSDTGADGERPSG